MVMELQSDAVGDGRKLERKYTQRGQNVSPQLRWEREPRDTKELALIVDDPDAGPEPFVHWVMYRIPSCTRRLPEDAGRITERAPEGAMQGTNSLGHQGWDGPDPPGNSGLHHYHFRLYALKDPIEGRPGMTKSDLLEAMEGHILDRAEMIATYSG